MVKRFFLSMAALCFSVPVLAQNNFAYHHYSSLNPTNWATTDTLCVGDTIEYFVVPDPSIEFTGRVFRWDLGPKADSTKMVGPTNESRIKIYYSRPNTWFWDGYILGAFVECRYLSPLAFRGEVFLGGGWGRGTRVQPCPPKIKMAVSKPIVCSGGCVQYTGYASRFPTQWHWEFQGGTPSTYDGPSPPEVCYSRAGAYKTILRVSNQWGVDSVVRDTTVTVPSSVTITSSIDQLLVMTEGQTAWLRPCARGLSYQWEASADLSCHDCERPILTASVSQSYACTVHNGDIACGEVCKVHTYVKPLPRECFVPNAFTPNGDGENDTFEPRCTAAARLLEWQVFDRWGNMVHNAANEPWDGRFNGEEAPADVYIYRGIYQSEATGGTEQLRGDILLIR